MKWAAWVAKALFASVTAFLGTLYTAYSDELVTGSEWIGIALATIIALGGVFGIRNGSDPRGQPPA